MGQRMKSKRFEDSISSRFLINVIDVVLLCVGFFLAHYAFLHSGQNYVTMPETQRNLVIAVLCYVPVAAFLPPVALRRVTGTDRIARNVFLTTTMHFILFLVVNFLLKTNHIPRGYLLSIYAIYTLLMLVERIAMFRYIKKVHNNGFSLARVLLVGNGEEMRELYFDLKTTTYGLDIEGLFATDIEKNLPEGVKLKGVPSQALPYLEKNADSIDAVYCSMASLNREDARALFSFCENNMIRFFMVPVYVNLTRRHMVNTQVGNSFVLAPREEPLRSFGNRAMKRTLDLVVSTIFLLTLFPIIYVIVAVVIKCQSPGPVFFRQKRNGLYGKEFYCYKFRSMHVNADADKVQATENDPRKFPFGDFMRRANIDELPQFINVFVGNMSLVGPRPHMLAHTEEYRKIVNRYMVRHWVKPGITGWAQVQGFRGETRYLSQMENRVHADIWYVENWSFWLDVRIIASTFFKTLLHKEENAY